MTAYGNIQDAVAAMKQGALDFLAKPVDSTTSCCSSSGRSPSAGLSPRTS